MIETERLLIRPLSAEELKKHYNSPDAFAKELGLKPSQSLVDNETKDAILSLFLPNIEDAKKDPHFYTMWIVIEKTQKVMIGGICFHGEPNENGEVEIGYGTDTEYRNKGYMTETISGMISWIRGNKKIKIIKAETEIENQSSIKVLEKNNFKVIEQIDKAVFLQYQL
ncbi:acetyltransferase [bacterium BRH_c32]|nr:MAG: acetyltransferase [bacterium BRH_c32]